MARASSSRRGSSRGTAWDALDALTTLGLRAGGIALILVSGYLLWGILTGSLARTSSYPQADLARVTSNILLACKILTASGVVVIFSAAIRYYSDEITGYVLLAGGALLHWGVPWLMGASFQGTSVQAAQLPFQVVSQFKLLGIIALATAVPFIIADFWYKMRGVQRTSYTRGAIVVSKDEQLPRSRLYIFCWQMPFCRSYLRKFCKAYEQRKSCWRIKSGCYCDEDMILRVMKRSGTTKATFDPRFSPVMGTKGKSLTSAEKRTRCRECFLYAEHQKQKYRILSPLAIPITVAIMWVYLKPVKMLLSKALAFTDQFAGRISFDPGQAQTIGSGWANAPATSETVQWLFLICIGLILVTYLLRGLEYCIFEKQI